MKAPSTTLIRWLDTCEVLQLVAAVIRQVCFLVPHLLGLQVLLSVCLFVSMFQEQMFCNFSKG